MIKNCENIFFGRKIIDSINLEGEIAHNLEFSRLKCTIYWILIQCGAPRLRDSNFILSAKRIYVNNF